MQKELVVPMGLLIGLDIGTTKLCAIALDTDGGTIEAVEDVLNDAQLPSDPDAAEQDASVIRSQAITLLSRLANRPEVRESDVLAIGVTGQMHGVVLVDSIGEPITPLVSWQDGRGNRPFPSTGHTYAAELARRLGPKAVESSGCSPATGYGAVTLLRMQEEGSISDNATALTIHDLVVKRLCGVGVTDPTDAASWGICDVQDGTRWLPEATDALRLRNSVLPGIKQTGSIAGYLLPDIARAIGLPSGIPVAVAIGDNQASFLGSVPSLQDTLLLNLGTGGQMSAPISRFTRADGLDTRPLVPGEWLFVGASLCGGRAYQVLHNFFAAVGRDIFNVTDAGILYDKMNQLTVQAEADCGGLAAFTQFDGSRVDPAQRARFEGISSSNLTPANLTRSVICGMVDELIGFYSIAEREGAKTTLLAGSGNAVRRNPLVVREIERRMQMPLKTPPHAEEAAVGAALTSGVACGVYDDWQAAGNALFRAS